MCILDVLYRSFEMTGVCFHVTITIKGKTNESCVDLWEGCVSPGVTSAKGWQRRGWPSHVHQ